MHYNTIIGSQSSLDFIESLVETPNEKIFETEYVQAVLEYKWKHLRFYAYFWMFI